MSGTSGGISNGIGARLNDALRPWLRRAFALLVAWPICLVVLGLNIRHRNRLPLKGPAIVTPNHNSHLDTAAMLTIFPLSVIPQVRPVAAADYFLKPGWMAWFSLNVVGIVPIMRKRPKVAVTADTAGGVSVGASVGAPVSAAGDTSMPEDDPLQGCYDALERGEILIIFPEGTRGEPERMQELKSGVAVLALKYPEVPVVPIFMHGLGKAMPKGSFIPVPFFVDVNIGMPMRWAADSAGGDKKAFMAALGSRMKILSEKHERPDYQ